MVRQRDGLDRLWTVPNALSCIRLPLVVVFVLLLSFNDSRFVAFALLAVAGVTDFLDGYVARAFGQVTNVGKLLDPTVDRVVLATAVCAMAVYGAVPTWLAVVVLVRETILLVAGVMLSIRGARRIDVLPIGKAGTFGLMCAFPLLLLGDGSGAVATAFTVIAWVILVPSLVLSWAAAFAYAPLAWRAACDVRAAALGIDSQ